MRKRGRPATGITPNYNIRLDRRAVTYADKLIGKNGCKSRSAVLREAVLYGLQCLDIKTGDYGARTRAEKLKDLLTND
jgi:hypothetical protein